MLSYYKCVPTKQQKLALFPRKGQQLLPKELFFCLKTPKRPQQKIVETIKIIQKRNVLRTKPWWDGYHPTSHPTISNHQPSTKTSSHPIRTIRTPAGHANRKKPHDV